MPIHKTFKSTSRHYRRQLKSLVFSTNVEAIGKLSQLSGAPTDQILTSYEATLDGLTEIQAKARLKQYGFNEVAKSHHAHWIVQLLSNFKAPFNILLMAIALISYLTASIESTIVISCMVLLSVFLRFIQEYRSNQSAEKLQALVSTTATVYRPLPRDVASTPASHRCEVPMSQLVPGDIVHLSSGDMVPADIRLISVKDLLVAESALTGESLPVEKVSEIPSEASKNPLELPNICFMGTNIVSGTAVGIVVLTGSNSYFGALANRLTTQDETTSFDKGIRSLTWLLIRSILVLVGIVFIINGLTKGNWLQAFLFALSVAVGLTPEMLPMIVTSNLAKGALSMAKKKVIVKRLNAIQNFGAMDILCTDKTGTLTQNKIILDKHLSIEGEESDKTLQYAYLNSYYQTGLKNLLDEAVLKHMEEDEQLKGITTVYEKVDEIPFDFQRRRMSVIVEKEHQAHLLICKGAVEEIFRVCSFAEENGEVSPIDEEIRESLLKTAQDLNEDGFRVVALAYKEVPMNDQNHKSQYATSDESELTLLGYISFLDPPKETASLAISALNQHGVQVKILTGDNDLVTRKVCKDVGLTVTKVVLGSEIEKLTNKQLSELVDEANIFAKLTPEHKERIIKVLRKKGHVVGFLGDGINDAPALKAADVGISVDSAVDIAKESADIILLEKNLLVLEEGVLEGRMVFGNIMKYIRMTTSSNFGNVFSIVGASALLPFLPMLPIHILIQNLLYDFSQTAIPLDSVDEAYLAQPRRWEIGNIKRFMLFFGPISSLFDYVTFGLLWFVLGATHVHQQSLFQSGWFVEGLLSQTIIIHMLRTAKIPFVQSSAAPILTVMTILVMAIGVYLPFSPFAHSIGMVPLPSMYFVGLVGILVSYCFLVQWAKQFFIRRFGFHN